MWTPATWSSSCASWTITHSKPNESVLRSIVESESRATPRSSSSASLSLDVNSPAESGLKMSAASPAVLSEHAVSSVTAAVESANSFSAAGP